jgi:hypothetical protein
MSVSGVSSNTSSYLTEVSGGTESTGKSESSTQSNGKVYDKRDTNKDGKVSLQEQMAWDLKHPKNASKSGANSQSSNTNSPVGTIVDTTA